MNNTFGPKNEDEEIIFAQQHMRGDIIHWIYKQLKENRWSEEYLAEKLDITHKKLTNYYLGGNSKADLSLQELVKIAFVLGYKVQFNMIKL